MGEAAADLKRAGVEFGPLGYRGSNEMLIAPKRTAMNAAIAIIDPHVPWYDAMRFYEVRIYTPEFNVAGVSILGVPFPTLGHSRYCSVAMTTGGPDTSDIFEEEINPCEPRSSIATTASGAISPFARRRSTSRTATRSSRARSRSRFRTMGRSWLARTARPTRWPSLTPTKSA